MTDWDWQTPEFGVVASESRELVTPPMKLLFIAWAALAISLLAFLASSVIGYAFGVVASIIGGFVIFNDLKRRSDPNYSSIDWFNPVAASTRYVILLTTLLHIVRLAIASAR